MSRFIPAHRGTRGQKDQPVHPRACGELQRTLCVGTTSVHPRHAGNSAPTSSPRRAFRFIPAHAGNSFQGMPDHVPAHL